MTQQLIAYLEKNDFTRINTNVPQIVILAQRHSGFVNLLLVIDNMSGNVVIADSVVAVKKKMQEQFEALGDVHIMTVIVGKVNEEMRAICAQDSFCWLIDEPTKKLMIFENQTPDFYGLKGRLEHFLSMEATESEMPVAQKVSFKERLNRLPLVTVILVAVNILVFLICTAIGDRVYNDGMLHGPSILEGHQYYRVITSMFLHAGMEHLSSNMLILYFLGEMIEKKFGRVRYTTLYFVAGLGAGVLSIGYEYYQNQFNGSVGASGAIFGLIGALLFLVLYHKGRFGTVTLPRMLFMIAYSVYSGFRGTNIDNAAHIGGLLTGFVVAAVLYLTIKRSKRK